MIVADSDVLIDYLNGREPAGQRIDGEIENGEIRVTAISRFELLAGARTRRQQEGVELLLLAIPTLPLDAAAVDRAARIHRDLQERGEVIGMADSLIAGTVLQHGAALLTRNRRHFARVPGLLVTALEEG